MGGPGCLPAATPERHDMFEAGWRRLGCPLSQLWVHYLGLGGNVDLFSLDAFLHGMMPLPPAQQDCLAHAINEDLDDLHQAALIPYLRAIDAPAVVRDPLTVLDELFRRPAAPQKPPAAEGTPEQPEPG